MSEPNAPSQPTPPGAPEPPAPPVEPAPPAAPPVPPVPRYGEYAPAGYVPPHQAPPQIAPGYEQQVPAGYQPVPPGYPQQPYGTASFPQQPGARKRKTWDLVLTIVLLVLGFLGMLAGLSYAAIFSDPTTLDQVFQQQGFSGFNGTVGAAPAILAGSHVVLYLLALGGSIPLLLTKRVAFWVPLTAGVIAAIVFWATLVGVFLSDPAFVSTYS